MLFFEKVGLNMIGCNDVDYIRKAILAMDKPFCLTDLYLRLEGTGITDRRLILRVLDELDEEGLIEYDRLEGVVDEPSSKANWAFRIA